MSNPHVSANVAATDAAETITPDLPVSSRALVKSISDVRRNHTKRLQTIMASIKKLKSYCKGINEKDTKKKWAR
jgi:hypothetical protein